MNSNVALAEGARHTVSAGDVIAFPTAHRSGLTFAVSVVNLQAAKCLPPTASGWVGVSAREACAMVLRTELDGLLIQAGTQDQAWAAVDRAKINDLLASWPGQ